MNKLETTDTAGQAPELGSGALFALVSRVIAHLDRADYPRDGICHHHGLSYTCENDNVGVAEHEGKLLVMVYRGSAKYERDANGDYVWHGYTATEHEGKADAVAKAVRATISETWNGKEGNDGVSIVLDRPCPEGLLVGIRNYRRMRDVFHPTPSEVDAFQRFSAWANVKGQLRREEKA